MTVDQYLAKRWEYLGRKGWQGRLTFETYRAANRLHVAHNMREGLIPKPDGSGWVRP